VIEGRALRIESDGLSLEAQFHLPEGEGPFPGIVICHPHPSYGGDMHNNVVGALVRCGLDNGVAALRFNFRGVGESEGEYEGGEGEMIDARAALDALKQLPEVSAENIVLAGYSFGAAIALRVANGRDDLKGVIAVSTPTVSGPLEEATASGPILLVSGDNDEYSDASALAAFEASLGQDIELHVVPGVDHFWWGSDDRLIEIAGKFLAWVFARPAVT